MTYRLRQAPQVWKLATDLGLKPKDNALADIVRMCVNQVRTFLAEYPCATLSELCDVVAAKVDTRFIEVQSDAQLLQLKEEFLGRGEIEFADLEEQLGSDVYAITFKLLKPTKLDRRFVSIIDCRGAKAWRCYFSKWHELAHLLTITPQMRLKFCRTHCVAEQKDPEEAAMDLIAGAVGFLPDLVQRHASGPISFEKIEELRTSLCPEASLQASLIGLVQSWPNAALLIQPALALRKRETASGSQATFDFREKPEPVLRAVSITSNEHARTLDLVIFRNMRVPKRSVIYEVCSHGASELEAVEDLAWWESTEGGRLPTRPALVQAKRYGGDVYALVSLAG